MSFCVAVRAFGKRDSTSAKTIRSKMRCLVSKVAPTVEKCRDMTGTLSPCDHSKAQPLIASIWLQITARDKLSLALLRARLLLSGGSAAGYCLKYLGVRACAPA